MIAKIEIREIANLELAYVTSIGEQGIATAYDTLVKWATSLGLLKIPAQKWSLFITIVLKPQIPKELG